MQVLMTNSGQQAQVDCDDVYKEALGAPEHKIMLGAAEHKTVAVPSQRFVLAFFRCSAASECGSFGSSVHAVLA